MRPAMFLLAMFLHALLTGGPTGGLAARAADPPAPAAAAEQAVASVIDDLGSADFSVRQAATDRLTRFGPEVIPALQRYAEHDDPEIRARVAGVIRSFEWMRQGAIIFEVIEGSRAERLGVRAGDVVVEDDDVDIVVHTDVGKATEGKADYTLHLWRDGRVVAVRVAGGGKIGINMSNWDVARGGNDQARGLAAMGRRPPDLDEAYRRLRAARDRGMADSHTFGRLAGLAARALDRAYAAEVYAAYRTTGVDCASGTHNPADVRHGRVPFNSPHTEWLLKRYRDEPFSPELYHELEDWFTRLGRNGPMAVELIAKPWPRRSDNVFDQSFHDLARMHVGLHERRYDDVLAVWAARANPGSTGFSRVTMALQAAVRAGRPAEAARLGLDLLDPDKRPAGRKDKDTSFFLFLFGLALSASVCD